MHVKVPKIKLPYSFIYFFIYLFISFHLSGQKNALFVLQLSMTFHDAKDPGNNRILAINNYYGLIWIP